jgi:hypothetical protein
MTPRYAAKVDTMKDKPLIPMGTPTPWGPICGVQTVNGERQYYMFANGCVSLMGAYTVEQAIAEPPDA